MRGLIDADTMLLVGSAPCFPHGVIDPISEIDALAAAADVWLHVDACVGGWIAPFFERVGRGTPVFDFRNTAVRSISAFDRLPLPFESSHPFASSLSHITCSSRPRWIRSATAALPPPSPRKISR